VGELGREDVLLPERRQQQQRQRHQVEDQQPHDGRPEREPEPTAGMRVEEPRDAAR